MDRKRFEKWLRNIYETQDEEISCTECFDQVSRFVDLEISGENAVIQMPQIKQHLNQCRACREEYETLRDLRLMEEKGEMPSRDDLEDSIS
ncbi:MAG: hypothetical protein M3Y68_11250 [Chloroflexota bacterium]|nr:hypothetical protein [Chloroflexota bacterium]